MPLFSIPHGGAADTGYVIGNSARFNGTTAYLNKTFGGAGSTKIFTFSYWIKFSAVGAVYSNILHGTGGNDYVRIHSTSRNYQMTGDSGGDSIITDAVFRDPTAWMHFCMTWDTNESTAADRFKLWINGVLETSFSTTTYPAEDDTFADFLTANAHYLGRHNTAIRYLDGYMSQVAIVDGTAYANTDFGEYDDSGNWRPINITGLTYGTNGSLFDFSNASDLGEDAVGSNDWTANNLTQVTDSPTDDANNDIGNFATLNILDRDKTAGTLTNGNLISKGSGAYSQIASTLPIKVKTYFEVTNTGDSVADGVRGSAGLYDSGVGGHIDTAVSIGSQTGVYGLSEADQVYENKVAGTNYTGTWDSGETRGFAVDPGTKKCWVTIDNGSNWLGTGDPTDTTSTETIDFSAATGDVFPISTNFGTGDTQTWNFGQSSFVGTAPTGYLKLHTGNLPAPEIADPSKYFQPKIYTGNGTAIGSGGLSVVLGGNTAMLPDSVWIKNRETGALHALTDIARGVTQELTPDQPVVEATRAEGLTAFNADGFTVGNDASYNTVNDSHAAWCWNTQGAAGSSNTAGSINTTTTSVGQTQGMSISTYTGTGSAATIGHGLGVKPKCIIVKERTNDTSEWYVYHEGMASDPQTDYLLLSTTAAKADLNTIWNDTAPTSSAPFVFSVGTHDDVNGSSDTYVAYCWAEIEGFSKFGSYEGNANLDGTFIYCGFRPAFIICKSVDSTSSWLMFDSKREGYNVDNDALVAEAGTVEATTDMIDIVASGFKQRDTTDPNVAETYIYMAWAEHPFGGDGVSQARAR